MIIDQAILKLFIDLKFGLRSAQKTKPCLVTLCFKRCATALLSWLDCSSTAATHQHDLVSDVEFNSVEFGIERLLPKTKHKNKETV